MSYATRIYIDATGAPNPRRWPRGVAPVIATQLHTLLAAHPDSQVPAESLTFLRRRQEDLEDALDLYQSRSQDADAIPAPPDPDTRLLAFATAEALAQPTTVDNLIDTRWRQTDDISRGHAGRIGSPLGVDAQRIQLRFFKEGRSFVRLPFAQQYIANDARLRALTPEDEEAAARLGIADLIEELRLLNLHFGRLLGLTEAKSPDDRPETPRERAERALERVIQATWSAIYAVWPGDNSAHTQIRSRLLSPILQALQA